MYAFFTSLENDLGEVETLCFRFYNVHISYQSVNSCYGNGSEYCRNMFAIKRVVIFINFLNSVEYNSEKQRYHYMKSVWHFNLHIAFISLSIDVNRLSLWTVQKLIERLRYSLSSNFNSPRSSKCSLCLFSRTTANLALYFWNCSV